MTCIPQCFQSENHVCLVPIPQTVHCHVQQRLNTDVEQIYSQLLLSIITILVLDFLREITLQPREESQCWFTQLSSYHITHVCMVSDVVSLWNYLCNEEK